MNRDIIIIIFTYLFNHICKFKYIKIANKEQVTMCQLIFMLLDLVNEN
jgi:hypothetical protein